MEAMGVGRGVRAGLMALVLGALLAGCGKSAPDAAQVPLEQIADAPAAVSPSRELPWPNLPVDRDRFAELIKPVAEAYCEQGRGYERSRQSSAECRERLAQRHEKCGQDMYAKLPPLIEIQGDLERYFSQYRSCARL